MIDVTMAMLDPTMVFTDPNDVVANVELTHDQKIEILRRWEYDAQAFSNWPTIPQVYVKGEFAPIDRSESWS
jgi:glutaredoxin-related protein